MKIKGWKKRTDASGKAWAVPDKKPPPVKKVKKAEVKKKKKVKIVLKKKKKTPKTPTPTPTPKTPTPKPDAELERKIKEKRKEADAATKKWKKWGGTLPGEKKKAIKGSKKHIAERRLHYATKRSRLIGEWQELKKRRNR